MGIIVHHRPANSALLWNVHLWEAAWDGNNVWDTPGTPTDAGVDFELPDVRDARKLQFKYQFTATATGENGWEPDDFTRRLFRISPAEVWTFEASARILYQNPYPAAVTFNPGDVLIFHVITQSAFRGGQIYAWNPYDSSVLPACFGESARDDTKGLSTFNVTLA